MRVRRRNHLGTRRVHLRVDGKRRSIDGILSLDHVAAVIHQNQVGRADLPEVHPERVHPEVVKPFWIAPVMCPATPSSNPKREKSRNAAASIRLRCTRSSAAVANLGGRGMFNTLAGAPGTCTSVPRPPKFATA